MDSANINTAEQNITQVKTALKAFVENEKIAKMLGKDFVSEMNDWEALIEKKAKSLSRWSYLVSSKGEKAPL